uniref:Uncharacterized protein n=1 Tax=Favella ehrenbergii TaxID=182087 RepID=A0A7S3MMK7_9SPIT|mmetsp:Transcript_25065/g.31387  ORF Transcript_25065/g.31387 Transcript_25065/m.31387 type:complete len:142 (+) Transcript_25065:1281-1706(+)
MRPMTAEGVFFGPKVWCTVKVQAQDDPVEELKQDPEPAPVQNPYQQQPEPVAQPEEQKREEPVIEQPKEPTYMELAAGHTLGAELIMLYEFGFKDFVVNEHLLTKYKDANVVAELMMSGQVAEESIQAIYRTAKSKQQNRQ